MENNNYQINHPICIIVKNTSETEQDAYLFDVMGKLNTKDIRIDSALSDKNYEQILEDLLKHSYKATMLMVVSGTGGHIDSNFPDDRRFISYYSKEDADAQIKQEDIPVVLDPHQYQIDRIIQKVDYTLNSFGHIKLSLNAWTKISVRVYYDEKTTVK